MPTNFELIQGFKNFRDLAICMSKNKICVNMDQFRLCDARGTDRCISEEEFTDDCRRCWLDFLTDDKGLDLSYLDEE